MDYLNDEFFEGLSKEEIEQLNSELCVSLGQIDTNSRHLELYVADMIPQAGMNKAFNYIKL